MLGSYTCQVGRALLAVVLVGASISRLQFAEDFVAPIVIKSPSKKRSFSASNGTLAVRDFAMVAPASSPTHAPETKKD